MKSGFTLVEIIIALFIVAILTLLTLPLINRRLEKTDEYLYYMAYKTVEKMGSQIVAIGETEPEDTAALQIQFAEDTANPVLVAYNNVRTFFEVLPKKFALNEEFIFRMLFPKALAESITFTTEQEYANWSSDDYNRLWLGYKVCMANKVVKNFVAGDGDKVPDQEKYFTCGDKSLNPALDFDQAGLTAPPRNENVKTLYPSDYPANDDSLAAELAEAIKSVVSEDKPDAKTFCLGDYKNIIGSDYKVRFVDEEDVYDPNEELEDGDAVVVEGDQDVFAGSSTGYCIAYKEETHTVIQAGSAEQGMTRPEFGNEYCSPSHNYYNMYNALSPTSVQCEPISGYELSENNSRVACPIVNDGTRAYAVRNSSIPADNANAYSCLNCKADFAEAEGRCCGEHMVASGGACVCVTGYQWKDSTHQACELSSCPKGYTFDKDKKICALNQPIVKASRFCELVNENWNTTSANCSTFSPIPGAGGSMSAAGAVASYYKDVYEASLGAREETKTTLMSIDSRPGAFSEIPPNIIFANGLKMWILSDRTASIPGLTYTTTPTSPLRNVCMNMHKKTEAECGTITNSYFCKAENACYSMDAQSVTGEGGMGDARNCCAAPKFADLAEELLNNPNYTQDDYYQDLRYYAISGFTVFVDINGDKGEGTLWKDVFPFYVSSNGTVYPGYPLDAIKVYYKNPTTALEQSMNRINNVYIGGNNEVWLPVDVYYYESTGKTREKKLAFSNVSFARAICSMRGVNKYAPYCRNLGAKFNGGSYNGNSISGDSYLLNDDPATSVNPCDTQKCYMSVRRRLGTL